MRIVLFPSRALVKWGLVTHLRTKSALLMLVFFLGVAYLGTAAFWPEGQINQMAYASREILVMLVLYFLGGAFIFIPGLAAETLTVEKERDTFDQLFLTLIRPGGIILAKLANVLGFYYLLVIGVMPVLGAVFFLVGIDWAQVLALFGLVSATAFSCGMAGILCSALFRKSIVSMVVSYILALCLSGAPLLLVVLFCEMIGIRSYNLHQLIEEIAKITSPFVGIIMLIEGRYSGIRTLSIAVPIGYQISVGLLFFLMARLILVRPPRPPKVALQKPIDDYRILEQRRKRFPYYLIDPLRRKKSIEDHRNPMLVKELRWGFLGRADRLIRMFYSVLILYLFVGVPSVFFHDYSGNGETIPFMLTQMIVSILAIPPVLANSLPKEYEMGNMDFLRSTLLTPQQIVLGKVMAGTINLFPLLCASGCVGVLMVFMTKDYAYLFMGYGSLGACVILSLGMSMFASLSTRRTSTSLAFGYGLTIMLYLGIPLLFLMLTMWLLPGYLRQGDFGRVIGFLSPISAYVMEYPASYSTLTHTMPLFSQYWLNNVVFFSTIGVGFLLLSILWFKHHEMKDK